MDNYKNLEIKLNIINQKLDKLLRIMINDHESDHDQIISKNHDHESDHESDLSDHDLIAWFSSDISALGFSPRDRDLMSCIRSIRFYHQKHLIIKNKSKYVASFLPAPRLAVNSSEDNPPDVTNGFENSYLDTFAEKMTDEVINLVLMQNKRTLGVLKVTLERVRSEKGWFRMITSMALKSNIIQEVIQ